MAKQLQLCTFHVGNLFLGVNVEDVQEVLLHQVMTQVPLAPEVVRGLINLRGQIVTAIDLRKRLRIHDAPPCEEPMNVIVNTGQGITSFLVDEIGDVIDLDTDDMEPPPHTVDDSTRSMLHGVFKTERRLLLMLDANKVMNQSEEMGYGCAST